MNKSFLNPTCLHSSLVRYFLIPFLILAVLPAGVYAFSGGESADGKQNIVDLMSRFVLQLGVIVVIARTAGILLKQVKLPIPSALVELLIGVAIGPSLLGGMPLPGFPEGLFKLAPAAMTTAMPVSPELYGIATVASIIMLFSAGLETNLSLLLRYSLIGLLVAVGGVVLSFIAGATVTIYFGELLGHPGLTLSNPAVLFMGMIGMSTSLAVTARILSEKRKMDSPEGVTILAAAVLDDIIGIVILTVVMSIVLTSGGAAGGGTGTMHTVHVIVQAICVLIAFTAAGIAFARPLSKLIKKFKTVAFISIFAFGLALIISGIFQKAGIAMIIGAYVVGLSLSKTDLGDTVRDSLEVMYDFFVPFFFIVMGMLVDVNAIMSKEVLLFGAIYSACMFCGKFLGCGIPTMFLNFNHFGTIRIGMGLAPRGELAIIIAGIGLATML
ncbi:MAG: cation:proton antiporter, partial [Chitinispirillia bacterium]|nr:cation:proton antiporter [Chitinispirillia bacterium]